MRVEELFVVARSPEDVFDYMANPANLASWQTSNVSVEALADGPPGPGSQFRERTKPPFGKEFEQVTEFTEFERPRRLRVHVVEGPQHIDGTWTLEPAGGGTRVHFLAEGELTGLMKALGPVISRLVARQFAGHHRNLKARLEGERGGGP